MGDGRVALILAVLVLTGMGNDGAAGAAELAAVGGTILAQDPKTAVIGSMPNAVISAGFVKEVITLVGIGAGVARHLVPMCGTLLARRRVGRAPLAS